MIDSQIFLGHLGKKRDKTVDTGPDVLFFCCDEKLGHHEFLLI
jgi:hypothetical protein